MNQKWLRTCMVVTFAVGCEWAMTSDDPWRPAAPYYEFTPPDKYRLMWNATAACVQQFHPLVGDRYADIRWYAVQADQFWNGEVWTFAVWSPNNRIFITEQNKDIAWIVSHEQIHALGHILDHPDNIFGPCTQYVWPEFPKPGRAMPPLWLNPQQ